jgi:hypothetical protein
MGCTGLYIVCQLFALHIGLNDGFAVERHLKGL